jgi:hypothetical protein
MDALGLLKQQLWFYVLASRLHLFTPKHLSLMGGVSLGVKCTYEELLAIGPTVIWSRDE